MREGKLRIIIDTGIFDLFSGLKIGVLFGKDLNNSGTSDDIRIGLREEAARIRNCCSRETLVDFPQIKAWREAYRAFGARPKKHLSSVESLYRMVLQGREVPEINPIVDIYNTVSLRHMIPMGGDDLARVEGDIRLTFAEGEEPFTALNSTVQETARQGEVIYRDTREVLCRRWNWRECDKTKMTRQTKRILLVAEGLPPVDRTGIISVIDDLEENLQRYCGGEYSRQILDSRNPEGFFMPELR